LSLIQKLQSAGHLGRSYPERPAQVVLQQHTNAHLNGLDDEKLSVKLSDVVKLVAESLADGKLTLPELLAIGVAVGRAVTSCARDKKPEPELPVAEVAEPAAEAAEPTAETAAETTLVPEGEEVEGAEGVEGEPSESSSSGGGKRRKKKD